MILVRLASAIAAILAVSACSQSSDDNTRFALPGALEEVSGLAAASAASVFAHDDENAIVHQIRLEDGRIVRSFALGSPTVEGDFEGIAAQNGVIYLVTSDGLIYASQVGEHRGRVDYEVYDTGIGVRCELEGLSRAPSDEHLLLLCKRLHVPGKMMHLEIYRWKLGTDHAEPEPWLSVPLGEVLTKRERAEFGPSGLEWDEQRRRILVVSGRSRKLLTFDERGGLMDSRNLDAARHPKAEGIAVLAGGPLVLADEGSATRKAHLSAYKVP